MTAINVGKPSHHTQFDPTKIGANDKSLEQLDAIKRLKIRRARGVIEDDPPGFDSTTDIRYINAPDH